jgi:hypothetical protein
MNLDLTAAIEAVIRADEDEMDRQYPDLGGVLRFDELEPDEQASHRVWAEAVVTAVAPLIAAQVAERIAAAIEAEIDMVNHAYVRTGMRAAARIAREAVR